MDAGDAVDAIVLAGGRSARLGQDKAAVQVGGLSLLDRVLRAVAPVAGRVIVVGPHRPRSVGTPRPITVREQPPGGGPVAAVAAALPVVCAPRVFVLAVDLPFLTTAALRALSTAGPAALAVDAAGRDQLLLGVWPSDAVRAAMPADPAGRSWGRTIAGIDVVRIRLPGDPPPESDCDTPAALAALRHQAAAHAAALDQATALAAGPGLRGD